MHAEWVTDGMGAARSVMPRNTRAEYAEAYLKFCIPRRMNNPAKLTIVMDTYGDNRINELTQHR